MSSETSKVKYTGFIPPRLKPIPKKCERATLIKLYGKNRKALEYWMGRSFVKYTPYQPPYETRYNPKALYVGAADLHQFKLGLHPNDYKRFAPSLNIKLKKGECIMDESKLYTETRVTDTQEMDDYEFMLSQQEEILWDFTLKTTK